MRSTALEGRLQHQCLLRLTEGTTLTPAEVASIPRIETYTLDQDRPNATGSITSCAQSSTKLRELIPVLEKLNASATVDVTKGRFVNSSALAQELSIRDDDLADQLTLLEALELVKLGQPLPSMDVFVGEYLATSKAIRNLKHIFNSQPSPITKGD